MKYKEGDKIKILYLDKWQKVEVGFHGVSAITVEIEDNGTAWFAVYLNSVIKSKYNAAFIDGVDY